MKQMGDGHVQPCVGDGLVGDLLVGSLVHGGGSVLLSRGSVSLSELDEVASEELSESNEDPDDELPAGMVDACVDDGVRMSHVTNPSPRRGEGDQYANRAHGS